MRKWILRVISVVLVVMLVCPVQVNAASKKRAKVAATWLKKVCKNSSNKTADMTGYYKKIKGRHVYGVSIRVKNLKTRDFKTLYYGDKKTYRALRKSCRNVGKRLGNTIKKYIKDDMIMAVEVVSKNYDTIWEFSNGKMTYERIRNKYAFGYDDDYWEVFFE